MNTSEIYDYLCNQIDELRCEYAKIVATQIEKNILYSRENLSVEEILEKRAYDMCKSEIAGKIRLCKRELSVLDYRYD